jgi:hypothetical protein
VVEAAGVMVTVEIPDLGIGTPGRYIGDAFVTHQGLRFKISASDAQLKTILMIWLLTPGPIVLIARVAGADGNLVVLNRPSVIDGAIEILAQLRM